eukprot:767412-Hanusia_phi.AAC.4
MTGQERDSPVKRKMEALEGVLQVSNGGGGLTRAKSRADQLVIGIPEQQQPGLCHCHLDIS